MEGCNVELARSGSRLHPGLFVSRSQLVVLQRAASKLEKNNKAILEAFPGGSLKEPQILDEQVPV